MPIMPSSPTVATSTAVPLFIIAVTEQTPPFGKNTWRMGAPRFKRTALTLSGTVFRSGKMRAKSSAGSAASKRFLGRPSSGGGRTTGGGRTGDERFLGMDTLHRDASGFREAV